jgi:5'-deoxynucleotidase YfbR-like HD superfamily hydrolase
MITWHDMAEAIVSDMTTVSKTEQHKADEKEAEADIVENVSSHLHLTLYTIYKTFDDRLTPEAQFVKALDKIEPMFHLFFLLARNLNMKVQYSAEWEADEYRSHRAKYVDDYPVLKCFDDVLFKETEDFYTSS